MRKSIEIPVWGHFLLIVLLILSIFSANPLLSIFSLGVIVFLTKLLWKKGEPPVLLFIVFIQWIQASTKILHANIYNKPLSVFSSIKHIEEAIILSLVGIIVLAVGMSLAVRKMNTLNFAQIYEVGKVLNTNRLIKIYFISLVVILGLSFIRSMMPSLSQIILAVQNIKWIVIFILVFSLLVKRERYFYIIIIFCIELIIGLTGYFAGFKTIFFFLLIAIATVRYRLNLSNMMPIGVALSSMIFFMILWTGIKGDYRDFLSKGERAQIILVSPDEQFIQLTKLVSDLDLKQFTNSVDQTLQRISYVDYFGHVLEYVPKIRKHEYGKLWLTAVEHILVPRVVFPAKAILPSDSELTMEYTGLRLASFAQGSSISIGYMGESYIDFGKFGMFVPILILGVLWGKFYKYFISKSKVKVIGFAFAVAVLINAYQLEMNSIKLLGSLIMQFIVLAILFKLTEVRLYKWLVS